MCKKGLFIDSCRNITIRLPCIAGFLCRAIFKGCAEIEFFGDIFTSALTGSNVWEVDTVAHATYIWTWVEAHSFIYYLQWWQESSDMLYWGQVLSELPSTQWRLLHQHCWWQVCNPDQNPLKWQVRVAFGCKGDRSTPVAGILRLGEGPPQVSRLSWKKKFKTDVL